MSRGKIRTAVEPGVGQMERRWIQDGKFPFLSDADHHMNGMWRPSHAYPEWTETKPRIGNANDLVFGVLIHATLNRVNTMRNTKGLRGEFMLSAIRMWDSSRRLLIWPPLYASLRSHSQAGGWDFSNKNPNSN